MEMILQSITAILDPSVLLFMLVGVVVGALIGALPGLSVVMAISILTPITFSLSPEQGLAMLIGVYNSGVWAGGISAILTGNSGIYYDNVRWICNDETRRGRSCIRN